MKLNFFILCLSLSALSIYGQRKTDLVYLKDGSIYKGVITGETGDVIKIETFSENLIVFNRDDILKLDSEPYFDKRAVKQKGYFNFISGGVLAGSTANELRAPFSGLMENCYRLNAYGAVSIVTGVEMLNEATVPLAIGVKGLLPVKGGTTLFVGGTAGYSFSVEEAKDPEYEIIDSYGGTMALAEIGILFPSYGHVSFFMAAGYRYNELSYKREDWFLEEVDQKKYFNRISLRVGIAFY